MFDGGVHGAGAVVVGGHQDVKRLGGSVFGAALQAVDACVGVVLVFGGFVVGLVYAEDGSGDCASGSERRRS